MGCYSFASCSRSVTTFRSGLVDRSLFSPRSQGLPLSPSTWKDSGKKLRQLCGTKYRIRKLLVSGKVWLKLLRVSDWSLFTYRYNICWKLISTSARFIHIQFIGTLNQGIIIGPIMISWYWTLYLHIWTIPTFACIWLYYPLNIVIFHSKYFPDSNWLKAHA